MRKLSYQAKGPFIIIEDLKHDSYSVRRYNHPESSVRKYKAQDLYLLPPHLFPSEELDTMDVRYLNYSHAPVPSPLKKPLCIELYNDVYFPPSKSIIDTTTDQPSTSLDSLAFQPHPLPATTTNSSTTQLPPVPPSLPITRPSVPLDNTLHSSIVKYADKLFSVQYTPERTLRPQWYLVSVDIKSTSET